MAILSRTLGIAMITVVCAALVCSTAVQADTKGDLQVSRPAPAKPWSEVVAPDTERLASASSVRHVMGGSGSGVQNAADHIANQQCVDGGWGWPHDDCSATYNNITGPIALGLLQAYEMTADSGHLTSATDGGDFDLTSQYGNGEARFGTGTLAFLYELSQVTGDSTYSDWAATEFFDELTASTYGPSDYDTAGWIGAVEAARTGTWVNLRPWEFQTLGLMAETIGNAGQKALFNTAVLDGLNTLDNTAPATVYSDLIGVAGGVRGLALNGTTSFPAIVSPLHSGINGISTLCALADKLVSYQNGDGSWYWHSGLGAPAEDDKDTQTTAYAVLALLAAQDQGCADLGDNIDDARTWMWSMQEANGGFLSYPTGDHNTEVEGEVLMAMTPPDDVFVDDDYSDGGGNDGHQWGYDAFDNIQDAINAVGNSTVNIAAGVYTAVDSALAIIDKSLTLVGAGESDDGSGTVLDGGTYGAGTDTTGLGNGWPRAIVVQAHDVTIRNMRIREYQGDQVTVGGYAIVARASASWDVPTSTIDNLLVEDVTFEDCYYGVRAESHNGALIQRTTFGADDGATGYAHYVSYSDGTTIRANTVNNGSIWVTAATNALIGGAAPADGNIVTDATYNGIWLGQQFAAGTGSAGTIQYNTVNGAVESGIAAWNYAGESTAGIQILDNLVSGTGDPGWDPNGGIAIYSVDSTPLEIRRNEVTGAASVGLRLQGATLDDVQITNNIFTGSTGADVALVGATLVDAVFFDNTLGSMTVTGGTGTLDASGNWWGTAVPADVKTGANGGTRVDYTPWLDAGTDTDAGARGFAGDFTTLNVDDDSPQTGSDGRIQEGVDLVSGSTINVAAGTYVENIIVDKKLTLRGAGSANTIIDASGGATGILISAGGVSVGDRLTIEDLKITGATGNGIRAYKAGGFNFHYVTFDDVVVTGSGGTGVELHNGTDVFDLKVLNCDFSSNGGVGMRTSSATPLDGLLIEDSHFDDGTYGVYLTKETVNVTIRNSTMNGNSQRGYWGSNGRVSNLLIEDCEANGNLQRGITVWSYDPINGIDGATIRRTTMNNNGFRGFHTGAATDYSETVATTVANLLLENCSLTGNGDMGYHVDLGLLSNVEIHDCDLSGNTNLGIKHTNVPISSGTVDASGNWWGSNTPAGVAAEIGGSVDYTPWLDDGTDTDLVANGFQGDFSTLHVDDDSPQVGSTGRVQEGIDMASGSTVNLAPGTYEEQVVIDVDDLHLIGSGSGTNPLVDSIIQSPVSLTYFFDSGSNDNYPVIGVHDATGGSIENLRVDGLGRANGNYRFVGIGFWNAGGDVIDCVVTGIREDPLSGAQHGVAIYAYNDTDGPYTINVTGTDVDDYQKNGMALLGTGLTANVSGCSATGAGPLGSGLPAQNGIQIGSGAGGSVAGCTVADHMYTGGGWAATGLLLLSGTSVAVTDTVLTDNQPSVYCIDTDATFGGLDLSHQNADSGDGFYAYNSTSGFRGAGNDPRLAASPIDEVDNGEGEGDNRTVMTVTVSNSVFVGYDAAFSWGVSAFATGSDAVNLTVTTSTVKDWDSGIVAYDYGGPVNLTANYNQIISNVTYGFENFFNPAVMDAENNWWGDSTGPEDLLGSDEADNPPCFDASTMSNTNGAGNAVTDLNVDYCPWLGGAGSLVLLAGSCQEDTEAGEAGNQIEVELRMLDLSQAVSGFQAFVEYPTGALSYRGDLSTYTVDPFALHIAGIDQADDGLLDLDGSVGFMPPQDPTKGNALLATLVFDVLAECGIETVNFDLDGEFDSELSLEGVPLPTNLEDVAFTSDDTDPEITVCPADLTTVECDGAGNEADVAVWRATFAATDDCGVTLTDDYTALSNGCGATGSATVTFTATDDCGNVATCMSTFIVEDTIAPDPICPADMTVECDESTDPLATGIAFFQGFETDRDGWFDYDGTLVRVASGTGGVTSADGSWHAEVTGTYTSWGAYSNVFPTGGYTTSVDIYLDVSLGLANDTRMDYSSAINRPSGDHRRDFIYSAGFYDSADMDGPGAGTDRFIMNFSNNAPGWPKNPGFNPISIDVTGWYTIEHHFYDDGGGVLAVDLNLYDSAGTLLNTWTLSEPTDIIGSTVGGNRYGWFLNMGWTLQVDNTFITGGAKATDDCTAFPEVTYTDSVAAGACPEESVITRTWSVEDDCGNIDTCDQIITVDDSTAPVIDACPDDIVVNADAGGCDAEVTYTAPGATDNCDATPVVTCVPASGSIFPTGLTTVTCTAVDECSNSDVGSVCEFDVTVNPVNDVNIAIQLAGVIDATTRCIHFESREAGDGCGATDDVELDFDNTGSFSGTVELSCGLWANVCVKDEQHTLFDTSTLTVSGTTYSATSVSLHGGDTDNDSDVDINDVTLLLVQYGNPASDGDCSWDGTRDADFSNNGVVWTEDYTLLTANWLTSSTCSCTIGMQGPDGPDSDLLTSISVTKLPADLARWADLNGDGKIDYKDVRKFERLNGLPSDLSSVMKASTRKGG